MAVNWNALAQAPNAGLAFSDAFQRAQQMKQQQALQAQQMQEHQEDRAFRQQQMQAQQHQAYIEQNRENIVRGAQIIRQVQPQDQAGWDRARALAQQAGVDVSQVPPQFDPQYVQGISALADALAPQKAGNAPTSYEEYQRAQADPNYGKFLEERRGPIVANNGDGTFTLIPRTSGQQGGGPQPGTVEDGYRFKGGNPADPNAWEPVNGGPTPRASAGFP